MSWSFFGADSDRDPDQVDLELVAGHRVDEAGEFVHRFADHGDVFGGDQALLLGDGGGVQYRG